jgi:hypothetical protein
MLAPSDRPTYFHPMRQRDRAEAAELLRRVLALVESGGLAADGPAGAGLVRRLEGALLAVEAMSVAEKPGLPRGGSEP